MIIPFNLKKIIKIIKCFVKKNINTINFIEKDSLSSRKNQLKKIMTDLIIYF